MSTVLFLGGIYAGFNDKWFRMGFLFFLAVFMVGSCVSFFLDMKIDSCFTRLENLISRESDSIQLRNPSRLVGIYVVIITPVLLFLTIQAVNRRYWLMASLFLSAFVINFFVSRDMFIALKIRTYSRRLEELISENKNVEVSNKQSEE
jgi:hypothetical protein